MVWPFRRKSTRRSLRDAQATFESRSRMPRRMSDHPGNNEEIDLERKRSVNGGRDLRINSGSSRKLQKRSTRRTYSYSPGQDNIGIISGAHKKHPVPPLPASGILYAHTWNANGTASTSSRPKQVTAGEWQRFPTLYRRRSREMVRRKSSRRRKNEQTREAEVRALCSHSGNPWLDIQDGKLPADRHNFRIKDGKLDNPQSEVPIPFIDIPDSMSTRAEKHKSFKLLGMFSPRPTIQYADNPSYTPLWNVSDPAHDESYSKLDEREPVAKWTFRQHKRVDELADGLTAGDLRELMERDQRRKERQREREQLRAQKKLARKLEKHTSAESEARRTGVPTPRNLDRGILGREIMGTAILREPASLEHLPREATESSSVERGRISTDTGRPSSDGHDILDDFIFAPSLAHTEAGSPAEEHEDPVIQTAKVARLSRASMSIPTSPTDATFASSLPAHQGIQRRVQTESSKPILKSPAESARPEERPEQRSSPRRSWMSFFRRGSRNKRAPGPLTFAVISRDTPVAASPRPSPMMEARRSSGNIPKRTMSRFREDLPEISTSSRDSGADMIPAAPASIAATVGAALTVGEFGESIGRHDTPTNGYPVHEAALKLQSGESPLLTGTTIETGHQSSETSPDAPDSAVLRESLAPIDSEGSWLSGRPRGNSGANHSTKRSSGALSGVESRLYPLRHSSSSFEYTRDSLGQADSTNDTGRTEDEYCSRITSRESATGPEIMSLVDDDERIGASPILANATWGAVARHPTLVRGERAKSREGVLRVLGGEGADRDDDSIFGEDEDYSFVDGSGSGQVTGPSGTPTGVKRATSVLLGKGEGVAKLLDMRPKETTAAP